MKKFQLEQLQRNRISNVLGEKRNLNRPLFPTKIKKGLKLNYSGNCSENRTFKVIKLSPYLEDNRRFSQVDYLKLDLPTQASFRRPMNAF